MLGSESKRAVSAEPEPEPRVLSTSRHQHAGMAPTASSGGSTLPSGFAVFTTFPDLLFILEFVSGWAGAWEGVGWAEPCTIAGLCAGFRTRFTGCVGPGSIGIAGPE